MDTKNKVYYLKTQKMEQKTLIIDPYCFFTEKRIFN